MENYDDYEHRLEEFVDNARQACHQCGNEIEECHKITPDPQKPWEQIQVCKICHKKATGQQARNERIMSSFNNLVLKAVEIK